MATATETLARGVKHHQAGELGKAEKIYQQVLRIDPNHPDALHLLGVSAHQAGQNEVAADYIRRAVKANPRQAAFHCNLGVAYRELKRFGEAKACYQRALAIGIEHHQAGELDKAKSVYLRIIEAIPDHADALHLFGVISHQAGESEASEHYIRRAIKADPRQAPYHCNLGVTYRAMQRLDEAEACYRKALELDPDYAEAHNNLGNVLNDQGRSAEAVTSCQRALRIRPDYADAYSNLGQAYQSDGLLDEAVKNYRVALDLNPQLAEAHSNLGIAYMLQNRFEQAAASLSQVVRINPENDDAHGLLGHTLESLGKDKEAAKHFQEALRLKPHCTRELQLVTRCPLVYDSNEEIDACREKMTADLERLSREPFEIDLASPSLIGCQPSFVLLFHGRDNRPLKEAHANLFRGCFPKRKLSKRTGKPRVGFVVTNGHEGIFMRHMWGLLQRFNQELFDLFLICSPASEQRFRNSIDCQSIHFLPIPVIFNRASDTIFDAEFDLLYYWEVGTDTLNYFLPFCRLAPVQCTSTGICDTSGTPEMDYYLVCEHCVAKNADHQFTETLIRAKTTLGYIPPPSLPPGTQTRDAFGFSAKEHLYLFPQKIHKFHPDMDPLFAELLRRDGNGRIVALTGDSGPAVEKLRNRLARTMPDVRDRVLLLPRQSYRDYFRFLVAADVVLDPMHYSGGTTTHDSLYFGKPVVTLPSQFARGRAALTISKIMRVTDCVVSTPRQYVDTAVRLTTDSDYRTDLQKRIMASNHLIFENTQAVRELEQIFVELIEKSRSL